MSQVTPVAATVISKNGTNIKEIKKETTTPELKKDGNKKLKLALAGLAAAGVVTAAGIAIYKGRTSKAVETLDEGAAKAADVLKETVQDNKLVSVKCNGFDRITTFKGGDVVCEIESDIRKYNPDKLTIRRDGTYSRIAHDYSDDISKKIMKHADEETKNYLSKRHGMLDDFLVWNPVLKEEVSADGSRTLEEIDCKFHKGGATKGFPILFKRTTEYSPKGWRTSKKITEIISRKDGSKVSNFAPKAEGSNRNKILGHAALPFRCENDWKIHKPNGVVEVWALDESGKPKLQDAIRSVFNKKDNTLTIYDAAPWQKEEIRGIFKKTLNNSSGNYSLKLVRPFMDGHN